MLSIALLDDHELFLEGTASFLISHDYSIAFKANTLTYFLTKMIENNPDLAIIDCVLPGIATLKHIKEIRLLYPSLPLIAFTQLFSPVIIQTLKHLGVIGYCNKKDTPMHLLVTINKVLQRKNAFPTENELNITEFEIEKKPLYGLLSEREYEVLMCISSGLQNKEIAAKLFLSVNTIEFHRKNIMQKLDAKNMASLIFNAIKLGLL